MGKPRLFQRQLLVTLTIPRSSRAADMADVSSYQFIGCVLSDGSLVTVHYLPKELFGQLTATQQSNGMLFW
jgi:hypothetical protein